ncbi:hypothetical protein [Novosphingobium gossypii]|uniref:hypothetical protein n=1 Tax=Novosphingobium gossypii TaxID=1604774 RepID=UPI003D1FE3EC
MHIDRTVAVSNASAASEGRIAGPNGVWDALVHGLEIEFGHGVSQGLAARFLDAEECDFLWDARIAERWIGQYDSAFEEAVELDRIAVLGSTGNGADWFVAVLIVDGEGDPHGIIARSDFVDRCEAEAAWVLAGGMRAM